MTRIWKNGEAKLVTGIFLAVILTGAFSTTDFMGKQLELDGDWSDMLRPLNRFGASCLASSGPWLTNDTFTKIHRRDHDFEPYPMPYRGAKKQPHVEKGHYLYVRCPVSFKTQENTLWFYLGRVYGPSAIYWNNKLVQRFQDNGISQFSISSEEFLDQNYVSVISLNQGVVRPGLATMLPLVYTTSRADLQRLVSAVNGYSVERPNLQFGIGFAIFLIVSITWLLGVRYLDVAWMIALSASYVTRAGLEYNPSISELDFVVDRYVAICNLAIGISTAMFIYRFLRLGQERYRLEIAAFLLFITSAIFLRLVNDTLFFDFRLLSEAPTYVTASLIAAIFIYGCKKFPTVSKSVNPGRAIRIKFILAFAGLTSVVLFGQVCFADSLGAAYGEWSYTILLLCNGCFLAADLVVYQEKNRAQMLYAQKLALDFEKDRAIAATAYMMAHDVRKPMRIMKQFLTELDGSSVSNMTEIVAPYKGRIEASIANVEAMLREVLEFGNKKDMINAEEISINQVVQDAVVHLPNDIKTKEFKISISASHTKMIKGDYTGLLRVTGNILENAVKAMPEGHQVKISTVDVARDGKSYVAVSVFNSGSYLSEEQISKIFDPFQRFGTYEGSGLGLAICKKIVLAHAGMISCSSEYGVGTTFTYSIPSSNSDETNSGHNVPHEVSFPGRKDGVSKRSDDKTLQASNAVLVEDDPFIIDEWKKHFGRQIAVYRSPQEFMKIHTGNVEFVICDLFFANISTPDQIRSYLKDVRAKFKDAFILVSTDLESLHGLEIDRACVDAQIPKRAHTYEEVIGLLGEIKLRRSCLMLQRSLNFLQLEGNSMYGVHLP